ncbi:very long chain fatty acid elongase AAEL008004-like [Brevipalpus obovatus]|uniref:very long chain fatty acid elongase AAEL008004-like n=1 Tax=Brevipalpus obovatus TaxID=246614 RepID=UPI003D9F5B39
MLNYIVQRYNFLMSLADPRVSHLPLMQSPIPTIVICLSYVYFVKILGPALMKNRKPFDVRRLMLVYNFFMVLFSVCLIIMGSRRYFTDLSFKCAPVNYSQSPEALEELYSSYIYYVSKFIEFLDTIFFVLRKKNEHVSALHVIHHGIMPFSVWWGVKFVPGGHAIFFGWANSIIHSIMYTYYGLAAFGPKVQKYLWWKKYLTLLQIIQFIAIGIHSFQLLFRECDFPKVFCYWIGFHGFLFLALFMDFYKKAYSVKEAKKAIITANDTSHTNGIANGNGHVLTTATNGKSIGRVKGIDFFACSNNSTHYNNCNNNNDWSELKKEE